MIDETLYNGKEFPNFLFKNSDLSYLFFEFDYLFSNEFWINFKKFLDYKSVFKIAIENIEPNGYIFYDEIEVKGLPQSFKLSTLTSRSQTYLNDPASFYMLVGRGLIYAPGNKDLFCLYLDRGYWIGILGYSDPIDKSLLHQHSIKDIADYLTINFKGERLPESFKETLDKNWK